MSPTQKHDGFELGDELTFVEGKGGLPFIKVDNDYAQALISIYGGQVLSFKSKPADNDLLFLSEKATYESGKAIKGGIPICWPWFGQDPEKKGRPAHGFARNSMWQLVKTTSNKAALNKTGTTQIVLALKDSEATKKLWPHSFKLSLTITIGKTLKLTLKTTNRSKQAFSITQALHTYFAVKDITKTRLAGLENAQYIDTTKEGYPLLTQQGEITFKQEVDRIYTQGSDVSLLDDDKQCVRIKPKASKTTVVWNPWSEISKNSGDLDDNAYQQFVCIETANAWDDIIEVLPNESFELGVEYF
ncbi:MAG: D-hexose-6-phosphate mutarotase [Cocleimonas sp.]